jgi:hypothetical protein
MEYDNTIVKKWPVVVELPALYCARTEEPQPYDAPEIRFGVATGRSYQEAHDDAVQVAAQILKDELKDNPDQQWIYERYIEQPELIVFHLGDYRMDLGSVEARWGASNVPVLPPLHEAAQIQILDELAFGGPLDPSDPYYEYKKRMLEIK